MNSNSVVRNAEFWSSNDARRAETAGLQAQMDSATNRTAKLEAGTNAWNASLTNAAPSGTGYSLIKSFLSGMLTLRDLLAGPGIAISTNADSVTVTATNIPVACLSTNGGTNAQIPKIVGGVVAWADDTGTGGGGGEANTASTSGSGLPITLSKAGVDLPFRGFGTNGTGLAWSTNADTIFISVLWEDFNATNDARYAGLSAFGSCTNRVQALENGTNGWNAAITNATNAGSLSLIKQISGKVLQLIGLKAGANITITDEGGTNWVIASTASGGGGSTGIWASASIGFDAQTLIGTNQSQVIAAPNVTPSMVVQVAWPSNLPGDSAWGYYIPSNGFVAIRRTCLVPNSAFTNTFAVLAGASNGVPVTSGAGLSSTNQFCVFTNSGWITKTESSSPDGTNLVDFTACGKHVITMTNNITLIPTNHTTGRGVNLTFIGGSTNWNVVFPAAWHRYAGSLTNSVPSNKWSSASVFYPQALTGEVSYVQEP
jgi:hypothetical protein